MTYSNVLAPARYLLRLWLVAGMCLVLPALAAAFQRAGDGVEGAGEQEVVIKREALKLTDPKTYRVSLHLEPWRTVELTAPVDGYLRTVTAKSGQKLNPQAEAFRLDDRRAELVSKRARAGLQAAQLERKIAQGKGDADLVALSEARLEAAQAEADLAQLELDRLVIRTPFAGEIERVHVVEGQFVRAGDRLATLIDASRLVVEIPVERGSAVVGGTMEIKVEETAAKAKIDSVIALGAQFEALRELAVSPASALVTIDNSAGALSAGQTVHCDLIPLNPVAVVPTVTISNVSDGTRRLQVLRENVVRDLTVKILGKVGTDDLYVSGRFLDGDEVIVSSTKPLADGTALRAVVAGAGPGKGGSPRAEPPAAGARKPAVGF